MTQPLPFLPHHAQTRAGLLAHGDSAASGFMALGARSLTANPVEWPSSQVHYREDSDLL
jgi:hypothetical protein